MSAETFDWIIAGAGIAGAAAAYNLAPHGRVLLLEREEQLGYHSTGRSEALFEPLYGGMVAEAFARASHRFLVEPPEGFADHALLHPRGGLYFAVRGDEDRLSALEQRAAAVGHELEARSPDEILRCCPIMKPNGLIGGIYDPQVSDIDVHALHSGYLRAMRGAEGRLVAGARDIAVSWNAGVWEVIADGNRYQAPVLVNAAGAWADEFAIAAGVPPLGHQPLRRTVVVVDLDDGLTTSFPHMEAISDGFYFKPESGRMMVSAADETLSEPCDAQPDELDVAITVARLEDITTLSIRRLANKWAGLRTFLPDRAPAVGFDRTAEGFFWLSGLGGYGIMTAPAIGECCSALLRGEDLPAHVAASGVTRSMLSPSRFMSAIDAPC